MAEDTIQPVKTYALVNVDSFTGRRLELQHNGQTFLWVYMGLGGLFAASPPVTLHNKSAEGPIVSAAKYSSLGHGPLVVIGNPNLSPAAPWVELSRPCFAREYQFDTPDGRPVVWRHTRNAALGASRWCGNDFKLLDLANGEKVLAVFIHDKAVLGPRYTGRIDWTVELEPDTELMAMTAIIMIQAQLRRNRRRNNASGASAGAGAGAF